MSFHLNLWEVKPNLLALLLILTFAFTGMGSTASAESKAHQHGAGHLNIAIDGQTVQMELIASGSDIVGFEHEPETDGQKQAIMEAATTLLDGETLFRFPPDAQCRATESEVESSLLEEEGHKEEHKHGRDQEHTEFHAYYQFKCASPGRLTHLEIEYFSKFPNAQTLSVQKFTPSGQSVQRLTAKATRLTF